jgi:hypothetical protein
MRGFVRFQDIRIGAVMDALQQVWHWVNLLVLPCGLAAIHASICKLLWRREMPHVSWWRLAGWCAVVALAVDLTGFAWLGNDGATLTYGAIIVALAVTTWLLAFAPWQRHAE